MIGLGIISNSTQLYLKETLAYLNSDPNLGTLPYGQMDAIDRFVRDLQGYDNPNYTTFNVWDRIVGLYPILGSTDSSTAINLASPGTFDLIHSGHPTTTDGSVSAMGYNGSSQFSDTGITPANTRLISDITSFGVHRRDSNNDSGFNIGINSSGITAMKITNDNSASVFSSNNSITSTTPQSIKGLWSVSYSTSAIGNEYFDGTRVKRNTGLTLGNSGNRSFYIGANHGTTGASFGGKNVVDFVFIANSAWTDAEQNFMATAFYSMQQTLGR